MVGGFVIVFIFIAIINYCLVRKGYYQTSTNIGFCILLLYLAYNMKHHLDVINTRETNPKKTLPYLIAVEHILGLIFMIEVAFLWYLQLAIVLIYGGLIGIYLDDYEH